MNGEEGSLTDERRTDGVLEDCVHYSEKFLRKGFWVGVVSVTFRKIIRLKGDVTLVCREL